VSVAASREHLPQSTPPSGGARPGDACPLCGASLRPQQEWCLRCGAAARTRLAAAPNWRLPVAVIAAVTALSLGVLAAALVKLAGDSTPARSQATTIAPATSAAPAPGAAATQPPATGQPGAAATQPGAPAQPGSTATASGGVTAPSTRTAPTGATSRTGAAPSSGTTPGAPATQSAPAAKTAPASR
jgi:hypothetical protein